MNLSEIVTVSIVLTTLLHLASMALIAHRIDRIADALQKRKAVRQ